MVDMMPYVSSCVKDLDSVIQGLILGGQPFLLATTIKAVLSKLGNKSSFPKL